MSIKHDEHDTDAGRNGWRDRSRLTCRGGLRAVCDSKCLPHVMQFTYGGCLPIDAPQHDIPEGRNVV